ncbi:GGDEF domain-containing protein [Klenkia sp. LSe6-5]|uniref:GGDEF domain-containing protein n=1 Tax=Klenkia sesuvii TaxID=3103137 RepID=A0ABU8DVL1_9ACTN
MPRAPWARRGPAWSRPLRPGLTRTVTVPLLLAGAVLLTAATALLPRAAGSGWSWALGAELLVHGLLVWVAPVRTALGDLAAASAAVAATVAIVAGTLLVGPGQHGWAILLCIPVLYASSHFRRGFAVVVTLLGCLGGAVVLVDTRPGSRIVLAVDAVLVGSSLLLLCGSVVLVMEHLGRLVAELERAAAVDGLTGLVTRRVLDAALAASLSTARTTVGTALVLVDLDHFKAVNDRHGHPVGDAVLRHVGEVLAAAVRSTDAVVSRFGGDELAVLLPSCPVAVARARAGDLVAAVRGAPLVLEDGTTVPLSVSVGVAHAPQHAADVRSLYSAADAALYVAKRAGRDGFAVARA